MKLRIKETDELLENVKFIDTTLNKIIIQYLDDGILRECTIKNLSDIEEVKDYEEPKQSALRLMILTLTNFIENEPSDNVDLEECKDMLEKMKAWQRLKDKGFKQYKSNICGDDFIVHFKLTNHVDYSQSMDDFDCIFDFGGEDE